MEPPAGCARHQQKRPPVPVALHGADGLLPPARAVNVISHWQVLEIPLDVLYILFVFATVNRSAPDYPVTSAPPCRRAQR